jgi:hypothetical protein
VILIKLLKTVTPEVVANSELQIYLSRINENVEYNKITLERRCDKENKNALKENHPQKFKSKIKYDK